MGHRLSAWWTQLTGTLWFVPGAIVVFMSGLAIAMIELSARIDAEVLRDFPRVFGASADSSRALLSAIAGAMITVAGLTFSLTMVAVTQASSQYTPRILRNFMRDRGNQVVLGVYVGIFAYCLLVVRTIRSGEEGRFVPSLAVVVGIALAMGSVGVLIFFVHHIASSLQASTIVRRIADETLSAIDRVFPEGVGEEAPEGAGRAVIAAVGAGAWQPVRAATTGYVQSLDAGGLLALADEHDLVVRLVAPVGDFVVEGTPVAWTAPHPSATRASAARTNGAGSGPAEPAVRDGAHVARRIAGLLTISAFRTVEQDAAFGVRQLVDIALKALSPGINDTTTAVACVDYLGAVLVRLADRRIEASTRARDGVLRVIAPGPTFESLLRLAVDEIRQNAGGNVGVLARLFAMLSLVASCTASAERRRLIAEQIDLVREAVDGTVTSPHDRERLRARAAEARAVAEGDARAVAGAQGRARAGTIAGLADPAASRSGRRPQPDA